MFSKKLMTATLALLMGSAGGLTQVYNSEAVQASGLTAVFMMTEDGSPCPASAGGFKALVVGARESYDYYFDQNIFYPCTAITEGTFIARHGVVASTEGHFSNFAFWSSDTVPSGNVGREFQKSSLVASTCWGVVNTTTDTVTISSVNGFSGNVQRLCVYNLAGITPI